MDTPFVKISDTMAPIFSQLSNIAASRGRSSGAAESPIEEKLLNELLRFRVPAITQVKIGKYRADIYIESQYRKIVVECDGKEFHTDHARDQKRDEYMEDKGILVLRFTGSEIFRTPKECAMKVIENISEIYSSNEYQRYLERYLNEQTSQESEDWNEENIY